MDLIYLLLKTNTTNMNYVIYLFNLLLVSCTNAKKNKNSFEKRGIIATKEEEKTFTMEKLLWAMMRRR